MPASFRLFISVIIFLLFSGCEPKLFSPEVLPNGITYSYRDPTALSIAVVGSFNHWNPAINRLSGPDASGIWTILLPLQPGRYEYRFVVNGTNWVLDPSAPSVDDGMGDRNSIVDVSN
jgi:1,4-alpha-glucan branching enzyme